jgi:hypothetical protein
VKIVEIPTSYKGVLKIGRKLFGESERLRETRELRDLHYRPARLLPFKLAKQKGAKDGQVDFLRE